MRFRSISDYRRTTSDLVEITCKEKAEIAEIAEQSTSTSDDQIKEREQKLYPLSRSYSSNNGKWKKNKIPSSHLFS